MTRRVIDRLDSRANRGPLAIGCRDREMWSSGEAETSLNRRGRCADDQEASPHTIAAPPKLERAPRSDHQAEGNDDERPFGRPRVSEHRGGERTDEEGGD